MEVHFTPEQEAQLAKLAASAGTRPETLVENAVLQLLGDEDQRAPASSDLPVWHLGNIGSLHRRDLYDDGR